MTTADDRGSEEDDLHVAPGLPGSGRRRYAAAMALHAKGRLPVAAVEAFRVLSARDGPDALALGAALGAERPEGEAAGRAALEALMAEFGQALRPLRGPGVGEARQALGRVALGRVAGPPQRPVDVSGGEEGSALLAAALPHLPPAARSFAPLLAEAAPHLPWTDGGGCEPVAPGHAYAPLAGGGPAPFAAEGVTIGLLLLAPGAFLRDHAHRAPELCVPLTGPHAWRFAPGAPLVDKAAMVPVWTDPDRPHAVRAGRAPLLALLARLAEPDAPARPVPAPDWAEIEAGIEASP